jgi:hypothetical protein
MVKTTVGACLGCFALFFRQKNSFKGLMDRLLFVICENAPKNCWLPPRRSRYRRGEEDGRGVGDVDQRVSRSVAVFSGKAQWLFAS